MELRKIVYITNAIESINLQLRKVPKNPERLPDKDAAMKLIYIGSALFWVTQGVFGHRTP